MSHTFPPCSSIEPQDRRPVPPEFDGPRRGPPCRRRLPWCNPEIFLRLVLRARCEMLPSPLLHLLDNLPQVFSHGRNGLARELHFAGGAFSCDNIKLAELVVLTGKIIAEMSPTAFFSVERSQRDNFRDGQQIVQVKRRVPAGVVFAVSIDADMLAFGLQFTNAIERLQDFRLGSHDAN